MKDENSKTANQAWRKKPRKFAPKSRLGCKTCKIRRIKCDLARPSCLKCHSTGRTCDGYGDMPVGFTAGVESGHSPNEKGNKAQDFGSYHPCTTMSAHQRVQWDRTYHGLTMQDLGPCMILPATGSGQAEAMSFFEYISIRDLNEYHPCESWRQTLMYFSQTVPSVRHAAMAVALIHRTYLDRNSTSHVHQSKSLEDHLTDNTALVHYNRAIHLLLHQQSSDSTEITAVTLLVCYLFTCFDHLSGNDVQAMKHLRGGVALSRSIDKAMPTENSTFDDTTLSGARALISQVTRQIRRLDMQAATFILDWDPADIQDTSVSQLPFADSVFRSLDQAADHLQTLIARVMQLRNREQQMAYVGQIPPSSSPVKDVIRGQLETWLSHFENMLQQARSYATEPETYSLISLLRLQHTTVWTLLRSSYGPGREMEYDSFLPQFRECVALASDVAAAHVRYSGSLKPTFTPEIGILPVLYMIGAKCRHPVVRRDVLGILRRQPIREAVWDSISTAKVVERIIEIEEAGSGEVGMIQSMDRIPASQRVENMSWIRVGGQFVTRMDITYTFCGREGMHAESLII